MDRRILKIKEKVELKQQLTKFEQRIYDDYVMELKIIDSVRKKKKKGIVLNDFEKIVLKKFHKAPAGTCGVPLSGRKFILENVNTDDWENSSSLATVLTLKRFFQACEDGATIRHASNLAGLNYSSVTKWLALGEVDEKNEVESYRAWFYRTTNQYISKNLQNCLDVINETDKAEVLLKWIQMRHKEYQNEETIHVKTESMSAEEIDNALKEFTEKKDLGKDAEEC